MKKYFELGDSAWAAGNLYGAFRLFLAGAKAGDSSCAHNLGYFYDNGIGVKRSIDKAVYWYLRACEGDPRQGSGAHNLALIYIEIGDLKRAKKYFKLAVKLAHLSSLFDLAELAFNAGDINEAEKLLRRLLAKGKNRTFPIVLERARRKLRKIEKLAM